MTVLVRGEGWHARLATREDDAALRALLREVPMEGPATVAQERRPDFFRWTELHPGVAETYVAVRDADGVAVGCGTAVVRDGWFPDGSRRPVGYVADLRIRSEHRDARVLPALGRAAFERAREVHGAEVFVTAVVDGNRRMVGTATSRRPARADQPVSRPMTPYEMVSVRVPRRARPRPLRAERAGPDDLDEVARFLADRSRARVLGYVLDRKELERRLATWPDLAPASFRLVRDGTGGLVACAAPVDLHEVRAMRVVAWRGELRAARAADALLAPLLGRPALPRAGGHLRYATLSHLEVEDDDPELLAALLDAAEADLTGRGLHLHATFVPLGSPLLRAFRGRGARRTPMTLYTTALAGSAAAELDLGTTRPGFEMALA